MFEIKHKIKAIAIIRIRPQKTKLVLASDGALIRLEVIVLGFSVRIPKNTAADANAVKVTAPIAIFWQVFFMLSLCNSP